jgi:hypothetical protein
MVSPIFAGAALDFGGLAVFPSGLLVTSAVVHAFNPHGGYQWFAYLLIAAGWILATTVVAGITCAINRQ